MGGGKVVRERTRKSVMYHVSLWYFSKTFHIFLKMIKLNCFSLNLNQLFSCSLCNITHLWAEWAEGISTYKVNSSFNSPSFSGPTGFMAQEKFCLGYNQAICFHSNWDMKEEKSSRIETCKPTQPEDHFLRLTAYLLKELPDFLCIFGSINVPQSSRLFSALSKTLNCQFIRVPILYGLKHFCGESTGAVTLKDLPSNHRHPPRHH